MFFSIAFFLFRLNFILIFMKMTFLISAINITSLLIVIHQVVLLILLQHWVPAGTPYPIFANIPMLLQLHRNMASRLLKWCIVGIGNKALSLILVLVILLTWWKICPYLILNSIFKTWWHCLIWLIQWARCVLIQEWFCNAWMKSH